MPLSANGLLSLAGGDHVHEHTYRNLKKCIYQFSNIRM